MRPDFDDLVGSDLDPGERARLERVHELLVTAGPPPEAAFDAPVTLLPTRRRGALLALAAALAVAAFALGAALVDGSSVGPPGMDLGPQCPPYTAYGLGNRGEIGA